MPWLSIFSFLISFFLSKKSGKSTAASAAIGAAVGVGTYYLADPSNPNNLFHIGVDSSGTAASGAPTTGSASTATSPVASGGANLGGLAGQTVSTAGQVLTSWGASGTAAVIGTTALATNSSLTKYLPWIVAGGIAFLMLRN